MLTDKTVAKRLWTQALLMAKYMTEAKIPEKPVVASYLFDDDALEIVEFVYPRVPSFGKTNGIFANKINAVGLYRRLTGKGLVESKKAIDSLLK